MSTIKPLDEQIVIMTACENGADIEYRSYDPDKPTWYDDISGVFNWGKSDYRIKKTVVETTPLKISSALEISSAMIEFIDTIPAKIKKGMLVHIRNEYVLPNVMVPDELKDELENWLDRFIFDNYPKMPIDFKIDTKHYLGVVPVDITYIGDCQFVDFSVDGVTRCKDSKK